MKDGICWLEIKGMTMPLGAGWLAGWRQLSKHTRNTRSTLDEQFGKINANSSRTSLDKCGRAMGGVRKPQGKTEYSRNATVRKTRFRKKVQSLNT